MTSTRNEPLISLPSLLGATAAERILVTVLLLLALTARLIPGERIVDDAYITFRYARNLADGIGFVYNPPSAGPCCSGPGTEGSTDCGGPVSGTTTPLYTLLLVGLALTLAVATSLRSRWRSTLWLAAFSALALPARPDTAILLGLLWLNLILGRFFDPARTRRRIPWQEGLITLAILAPWLIFGTLYFGSPLTASIAAKSSAYRLDATEGLVRLIQHYSTPFFEHAVLGRSWQLTGFAVYLMLAALSGLRAIRRDHRA